MALLAARLQGARVHLGLSHDGPHGSENPAEARRIWLFRRTPATLVDALFASAERATSADGFHVPYGFYSTEGNQALAGQWDAVRAQRRLQGLGTPSGRRFG